MTGFNELRKQRIKGLRSEYRFQIDPEDEQDNPDAADVAVTYEYEGLAIVLLPTAAPGLLDLEVHTFIDGEQDQPPVTVTIRRQA